MKESTQILNWFAEKIKPNIYIEIGVKRAQTLNVVAKHCMTAIGVDPVDCNKYITESNVIFYEMTSNEFFGRRSFSNIANKKYNIDMVFIDGAHNKEQVELDYINIRPYLSDRGWIFIHDTAPPDKNHLNKNLCGDVWEYIVNLKKNMNYSKWELMTIPCMFGLTAIHKKSNQLNWEK